MKKATGILMILLAWAGTQSCRQENRNTEAEAIGTETLISGVLKGGEGMEVLLEEMGSREYIPIDTVRCDSEGAFRISFRPEQMAFYVLRSGGQSYLTLLMEPGEHLEVNGEYGHSGSYHLRGSPASIQLSILDREHKRVLADLRERSAAMREASMQENFREIRMELDRQMDSISSYFRTYSIEFIEKNKTSPVMLIALYNLYGRDYPVFDPTADFAIYLRVDSLLQETHPKLEASRDLHAQLLEVKSTMKEGGAAHGPAVGQFAPDFVSSRPNGSSLSLSDLKGQWVLLGFWAAWSKPGLEDLDKLKEALKEYHNSGFTILQVSLDSEHGKWVETIGEKDLDWHHVSDLKGWESPLAELYSVNRIPEYYLVGPQGTIIDKGFEAGELMNKLQHFISK